MKPRLLVILGPTATGKSSLAIELAKKFNGEVISADSRQIYTGLNIGTGKVTKKEMLGIPHHMLDIISPKKTFSVAQFQKKAEQIISDIISRGKLPILCGGTGFYIQSIVDGVILPEVPPNKPLRTRLEKMSLVKLVSLLKKLDIRRLENIDTKNPVRLIRAIEIATALGKVPKITTKKGNYDVLQIGLTLPLPELKKKIYTRLLERIKMGMIREAENLKKGGVSLKRMNALGLEYRYLALYLEKKLTKQEFVEKLESEIYKYAKRQITWFKRDPRIKWYNFTETRKIEALIGKFID